MLSLSKKKHRPNCLERYFYIYFLALTAPRHSLALGTSCKTSQPMGTRYNLAPAGGLVLRNFILDNQDGWDKHYEWLKENSEKLVKFFYSKIIEIKNES